MTSTQATDARPAPGAPRRRTADRLTATTFIQRVATTGGLPPAAADCGPATQGASAETPYTADYVFWKATGNNPAMTQEVTP